MSHAYYLWASYSMAAAAILVELIALYVRSSRARCLVEEERDLEAQD